MILFELRCAHDHSFEAWFRDGAAYEEQAEAGAVACPYCGDTKVGKAPMAPRIARRRGDAEEAKAREVMTQMRAKLIEMRRHVESNFEHVGEHFPEEVRRIHYGETEHRDIYGDASAEEARDLEDEGIAIARIPWVPTDS